METYLKYRAFKHQKKLVELQYETELWKIDLDFIHTELDFLKQLIQTFPFKNKMFNLFERIQLFVKDIDNLKNEKDKIIVEIIAHNKELDNLVESINTHEKITASIFEFNQTLKSFKIEFYNYLQASNTSN